MGVGGDGIEDWQIGSDGIDEPTTQTGFGRFIANRINSRNPQGVFTIGERVCGYCEIA